MLATTAGKVRITSYSGQTTDCGQSAIDDLDMFSQRHHLFAFATQKFPKSWGAISDMISTFLRVRIFL